MLKLVNRLEVFAYLDGASTDIEDFAAKSQAWLRPAVLAHLRCGFGCEPSEAVGLLDEWLKAKELA